MTPHRLAHISLLFILLKVIICIDFYPEGVHIAKGVTSGEIRISWTTMRNPMDTRVQYGYNSSNLFATQNGTRYELITMGRVETLHYVTIPGLRHSTEYFYKVGSGRAWSDLFSFRTYPPDTDTDWSPRIAMYGDLGIVNGKSLAFLKEGVNNNEYDMILHLGDIAYDLFTLQGRVGDMFMRAIEPIASRVPYMVIPGNHEYLPGIGDGGRNYVSRFMMMSDNNQYTFTLGPIRFVGINSEVYFMSEGGNPVRAHLQLRWLDQVLAASNKPDKRTSHPWVIVMMHRPVYCSSAQFGRCPGGTSWLREGMRILNFPGLEPLFYKHQVDLVFCGHSHHYERSYPVYKKKVMTFNESDPYVNPLAPIYVVTGVPGNPEIRDRGEEFVTVKYPWSGYRSREMSFTKLDMINKTHLRLQQLSVSNNLDVIDTFTIIKSNKFKKNYSHLDL